MSTTPDQIAERIKAQVVQSTGLSCELGTPERKIIDAVSQAISAAYISTYLTGSLLDIETKTGLELDQFVGIFGFGRLQGKAAEGVVTLEVKTPLKQNYTIAKGTQFFTRNGLASTTTIFFASTQEIILTAGTYSVEIPVKCTSVGVAGNVPPDSVTFMGSILGSSTSTNMLAMTGGADIETDAELRHRFQNTLLRNVTGTEDWYKALCINNNTVSRVAVYGPVSMYRTQISAPAGSGNPSELLPVNRSTTVGGSPGTDIAYIWQGMESVFVNLNQPNEKFYSKGTDYLLATGSATPEFQRMSNGDIDADQIVDIEFQYTSSASRNDPLNGITNKVDVYVDGASPFTVSEATTVGSTVITGSPDENSQFYTEDEDLQDTESPYYSGNFERIGSISDVAAPGNLFTRLNSCPIISFPKTITMGASVYAMGEDYWLVKDITKRRGSPYEVSGIEWSTGPGAPSSSAKMVVNYVYNHTPQALTTVMSSAKQICTDVMVHQADYRYIQPCLNIQYSHGYDVATTDTAINNRLKLFFQELGFGAWIDISKMCLSVQQVLGVSSVSLTPDPGLGQPNSYFGVRVYKNSNDATFYQEKANFKLADNQIAQFLSVKIKREPTP